MPSLDTDRFFILESLGSRSEQEDAAVFMADPTTGNALLVVCDGVGGSHDGGGASRFTTQFAAVKNPDEFVRRDPLTSVR